MCMWRRYLRGIFPATRYVPILLLVAACINITNAQVLPQHSVISRIDSQAVWHPPKDFKQKMDTECAKLSGHEFQACFISLIRKLGASDEALRFISMTDTTGYLRYYRKTGNVDVAYVFYPFRANENSGVILVNGTPGMVDVDDLSLLDLPALKRDSCYLKIVGKFPDAALWPDDRYSLKKPESETLEDGAQRFFVSYRLQNGCHACELIGSVVFAFEFDRDGKFTGTRLIKVTSLYR